MSQRRTALVNVNMDIDEVAEILVVDPGDVVHWGNGWAVVSDDANDASDVYDEEE